MAHKGFIRVSFSLLFLGLSLDTFSQIPGPTKITSPRPLAQAAELLQNLYGKVTTYEEPVWVWRGELESMKGRDPETKWGLNPKLQIMTMPQETGTERNLAAIVTRTVDNYNQQISGVKFQMLQSKWGYHIVPAQIHDESGALIPARNLLDAQITVPNQERPPSQHFRALISAVSLSTGIRVLAGVQDFRGFDRLFRVTPSSFSWGVNGMTARDALIDLLERSATTFSWQLNCQASARAEDRLCALNMSMLEVVVSDTSGQPAKRVLKFDRCGDCPAPIPPSVPAKNR